MGNLPVPEKKKRKVKLSLPKTAMSLKPGTQLMDLLLLPHPTERVKAIQDAWAFRFPVTQWAGDVTLQSTPQVIFAPTQYTVHHRKTKVFKEIADKALTKALGNEEAYLED